jgi:hypothetical protein
VQRVAVILPEVAAKLVACLRLQRDADAVLDGEQRERIEDHTAAINTGSRVRGSTVRSFGFGVRLREYA